MMSKRIDAIPQQNESKSAKAGLASIVSPLLRWYAANARELPWRENTDPYRVWVSEIMLQQTRVEAVKTYYVRFLKELPDVASLAAVDEEKLLKLWEGLGYYSRARNLQKAAKVICLEYGGRFPETYEEIRALPGVGPYTAGAIASIAFDLPEPAVDGNVLRVLARLEENGTDINDPKRKKQATEELRAVYPKVQCGDFTQSLMELGATVCLPNGVPLCDICPLQGCCCAYAHGRQMDFPVKGTKKARKKEKKTVMILRRGDRIAIEKRPDKGLLAGLWQFPMLEGSKAKDEIFQWLADQEFQWDDIESAGKHKHVFTHVEWEMTGFLVELGGEDGSHFTWVTMEEQQERYSLPSAFRPFMDCLQKNVMR